ncbi:Lanosterol 14-alpha-demethylase [Steccherinum ochraceum]|uniref:Lanosterol 14-alpha-demethylase n=1 Tax=Steccherinum ochraceum TaxID=92696 RepID=A0A4V2MVF2_9APHY|nr:Lanosterol 14-alpha-demethylase [Steccherinum ochraceum]
MSFNATFGEPWNGYVGHLSEQIASVPPTRLALLALVNLPIIAIVLNVLYQLLPKDPSRPPVVWHWIPLFGSAASYGQDPIKFYQECGEKYGNIFTFILLGRRCTVTLGAEGNNFVLGGKHTDLCAEDAYTHLTTPVFGKDVVYDCPNELLMEQKKFVKFGLRNDNFRTYMPMIEDEVTQFMKKQDHFRIFQMNDINEWGTFDVLDVMSEITILTASRTLQGPEVRDTITASYADVFSDLDGGFTPIHWLFPSLPLPSYRKRDIAHKKISDLYVSIIRKRRESGSKLEAPDMIASLMEQKYRSGRALKDHEIAHIMIALLMAGQHTSSATGSWLMLHVADHPEIGEALYQEQVKNFRLPNGKWRTMDFEEIKDLPVLDSVIRETLRVHPPIHSIMRKVRTDIAVPATLASPSENGTYVVPTGDYVWSSPAVSQLDPRIWKNSNEWDPTRWSDPQGMAAAAGRAYEDSEGAKIDYGFGLVSKGTDSPYQPFGAGRHRCIGEQFAYLQLSSVIATVIRQVELKLETPFPQPNYQTLITLPKKPRAISYRRRQFD